MREKKETPFEKDFRKNVNAFLWNENIKISTLGNNKIVHYSNIENLTNFFLYNKGVLTSNVIGRILKYIKHIENLKK